MVWFAALGAVYVAVLLIVAYVSLHPYRIPLWLSPEILGVKSEEILLQSRGQDLRAWWMPLANAKGVVILAHGYMMNRSELLPEVLVLQRNGYACFTFDFPHHGKSRGGRCTMGYLEGKDVLAAADWIHERIPGLPVISMGSSMGAAATVFAAAERPEAFQAIVLDGAYGRFTSATLGWWRFVGGTLLQVLLAPTVLIAWPMARFNPFQVDIAERLRSMGSKPVLFIHGSKDTLALPSEATRNFEATVGPKTMAWMEGFGHAEGRWENPNRYHDVLLRFLEEHGTPRSSGT